MNANGNCTGWHLSSVVPTATTSPLAGWAVMRPPPTQDETLYRRAADQTRLSGTQVHTMLELEKALATFGVDVI